MFASPYFKPVNLTGRNLSKDDLQNCGCFENTKKNSGKLPTGTQTFWGIPFECGDSFVYVGEKETSLSLDFENFSARYIIFLHASETPGQTPDEYGIIKNYRGPTPLMEPICEYAIKYSDGSKAVLPIRSRMEINDMNTWWGQGAFLSKPHVRGRSFESATDDIYSGRKAERAWGNSQTLVESEGSWDLSQSIYAFENPEPQKTIAGMEIIRKNGSVFLFGVTASGLSSHPLRYGRRQKALLDLDGDSNNAFDLIDIDLGHIISVTPQQIYDNAKWETSDQNESPKKAEGRYIVEFDAHEDAILYLGEKREPLAFKDIAKNPDMNIIPAEQPVNLKVCDAQGRPVPVKVHAHGAAGEYLPPKNRHRLPNPYWFEDYSTDYTRDWHWCTYIDGAAEYLLPCGAVYFEVSKGFEIKPVRQKFEVTPETREITITLERLCDWRAKGWVTADTHVHFLSPQTALLEGEAEGVNVVNLLASQWGELFTNIGDFTGAGETKTPNGEYMVRVGTENRQHIMGHISLLGYEGAMILPLTTGGPDESAQGDPVEFTLTQWAAKCRSQNGLVILPHFPNPRAENAAAIVSELIDGVEVTKLGATGISPHYLSDWYRYLNCGYNMAAVGGTDKMSAGTAVGEMRTYAKIDGPLCYQTWKEAVIARRTFVTSGALVDMRVEGQGMGGSLNLASGGGNLTVEWDVASAVIPISSLELVINGETAETIRFEGLLGEKSGYFSANIKESAWIALRVRGRLEKNQPEVITAHTSAVFVTVAGKPLFSAPDASTILDQIEGATAYLKVMGTKAQESQFKLALAALEGAHRALHNKMHASGHYHSHTPEDAHG